MLQLEEAQGRIRAKLNQMPAETVPVQQATGRVLRGDVRARVSLPTFDNSAMDGYAVRSGDVAGAGASTPVGLRLIGEVPAGKMFEGNVETGTCVRIFTGSPMPSGADAVVMQEDTRKSEDASCVLILDKVRPWENIRIEGEDVRAGAALLNAGARISAPQAGLLAATGIETVSVSRKPVVALLATGDELRQPGETLQSGQIYESNRIMLSGLVEQAGAVAKAYPLVPDKLDATREAIERAASECDAIVTSGGASVGDHDYVKEAITSLGGTMDFWRVAIKPGKPFVFGEVKGKPVFGLPGNPVSAFVTFLLLVRPALLHMTAFAGNPLPLRPGILIEALANRGDRRHFMRVMLADNGTVRPAILQSSHALGSLAGANGLVDVAAGNVLETGSTVRVLTWD